MQIEFSGTPQERSLNSIRTVLAADPVLGLHAVAGSRGWEYTFIIIKIRVDATGCYANVYHRNPDRGTAGWHFATEVNLNNYTLSPRV